MTWHFSSWRDWNSEGGLDWINNAPCIPASTKHHTDKIRPTTFFLLLSLSTKTNKNHDSGVQHQHFQPLQRYHAHLKSSGKGLHKPKNSIPSVISSFNYPPSPSFLMVCICDGERLLFLFIFCLLKTCSVSVTSVLVLLSKITWGTHGTTVDAQGEF